MKSITEIIIKIITFPITVIKWIFYGTLTYILVFSIGFVIDRYVGWHPVIKPVRDSALTITIGIVKKTTPYLQSIATKFEANEQHTAYATKIDKEQKDVAKNIEQEEQAKVQKAEALYDALENTPIVQKLTENITTLQKSMEVMSKKANTQQKANWSPKILYGVVTLNILLSLIVLYFLYQIIQK